MTLTDDHKEKLENFINNFFKSDAEFIAYLILAWNKECKVSKFEGRKPSEEVAMTYILNDAKCFYEGRRVDDWWM